MIKRQEMFLANGTEQQKSHVLAIVVFSLLTNLTVQCRYTSPGQFSSIVNFQNEDIALRYCYMKFGLINGYVE